MCPWPVLHQEEAVVDLLTCGAVVSLLSDYRILVRVPCFSIEKA